MNTYKYLSNQYVNCSLHRIELQYQNYGITPTAKHRHEIRLAGLSSTRSHCRDDSRRRGHGTDLYVRQPYRASRNAGALDIRSAEHVRSGRLPEEAKKSVELARAWEAVRRQAARLGALADPILEFGFGEGARSVAG